MRHVKKRTRSTADRYFKNRSIKIGEYSLSIGSGGTVYWLSGQGNRKLDSMFIAGALQVSLPNDTTVSIVQDKEGKLKEKVK